MSQEILINWAPQETRVAVVEYGAVQEMHLERTLERGRVGNIYLGRVARVLPGMQSAFVDIGLERAAFLHVADLVPAPASAAPASLAIATEKIATTADEQGAEGRLGLVPSATPATPAATPAATPLPIEKQLFEGQSIVVQVIKDPIGSKGARLSAQISIAGRLLVFLPHDDHIGVSQKIPGAQREALRTRVQALVDASAPADAPTRSHKRAGGGFILRTNAEDATDAELADDIAYLRKAWARVREGAARLPPRSLIHQDLSLLQRVLRDLVTDATTAVWIDSREQFTALQQFGREFTPSSVGKLQHYTGERPIFDLHNIDADIARALGRRVDLKSGGFLVIDQTEALTTIDINTGGYVGVRSFDETIFKTNLEAAQAIARQLRLRNLGGIVIIDFIDMAREPHREAVLAELRKQLARDRVKTMVGAFSNLGLVEMTRKRTRESLAHVLCEPCDHCQGRGHLKTPRSVAYDILREILREARQFNPKEFRVLAAPRVAELLQEEESAYLAGLSEFIGKPIAIVSEPSMGVEQYDIVLV
jgi:ribonuclease G